MVLDPCVVQLGQATQYSAGKTRGSCCKGKIGSLPGTIEQDGSFQWVEVARGVQKTLDWQDKRMATN